MKRFQFSLRTLLVATTIFAMACAAIPPAMAKRREQQFEQHIMQCEILMLEGCVMSSRCEQLLIQEIARSKTKLRKLKGR